jgi:protein-S-isoprenylcysteine O-methyltransferase Ste14
MTPTRPGAWIIAILCCPIALAGQTALGLRVLGLGLDLWPAAAEPASASAWLIDGGWLAALALQHSGMARQSFKRIWTRLIPDYLERSVYAAASGLVLAAMCWWWQPVPGEPWWHLPLVVEAGAILGAVGIALVALRFDGLGLLGIRQVWEHGRSKEPDRLLIVGPYRWVRHPLMACLLVFLWCHPVMPPTLALLSGGLTVYILLALLLEERDLTARFGAAYRAYRQRVPLLVPWR